MDDPQRILVTAMDHLGDLVNTMPVLHALRAQFPAAHITLEAHHGARELADRIPGIDRTWLRGPRRGLRGRLRRFLRMRSGWFDTAYLLDCDNTSVVMAWLCRIPRRYGAVKDRHAGLLTMHAARLPGRHETLDPFRRLMDAAGVATDDWRPRLSASPQASARARRALTDGGWDASAPLVGLAIGTSDRRRTWTRDGFAAVADAAADAGATPVLLGCARDVGAAAEIVLRCSGHPLDLTGRFGIAELVAVLAACRVVVAGDTGPMHMAPALGVPVTALYGPSDPAVTGPADRSFCTIVRSPSGRMDDIPVADVIDSVRSALAAGRGQARE